MDYLNMDKDMMYSIVNMKLRDFYPDLEDFCKSENIDIEEFNNRLESLNLTYNSENNKLEEL